jgi:IclR family KDG regulon transcriptional repressor
LSKPIRAVSRALDVLLCFSRESPELTLTEISERVKLHKSTVHRVLATLENAGFLEHDPATAKYRLGLRLLELASLVLEHVDLRRQAWPYLVRLAHEYRETVDLGILNGTDIIYLEVIESPQRVKLAVARGQRLPVCCTASGKAMLAFLPEKQVRQIMVQGLNRYTEHTIVSPENLLADLRVAHERGFAISQAEYEEDIHAVAAPILSIRQEPLAVVALAGPAFRLPLERMMELGPHVRQCANDIARDIGLTAALAPGIRPSEVLQKGLRLKREGDDAVGT